MEIYLNTSSLVFLSVANLILYDLLLNNYVHLKKELHSEAIYVADFIGIHITLKKTHYYNTENHLFWHYSPLPNSGV